MFDPKYTISPKLLKNIKRVSTLVFELNHKRFPRLVEMEMVRRAHEISAHASTSIEGNPLPLTDVRELLKTNPKHIRDSEREVLNYNRALIWLDRESRKKNPKFDLSLLLRIHAEVMMNLMPDVRCGKIRKEPVFVNDPQLGKTVYWPPDHQDVRRLMGELLIFIKENRDSLDPLLMAGIFHKQFVIIHPFMDGNGRTVRLGTKILLSAMGLDTFNLFSFENYYHQNISRYFTYVGVKGNYYEIKIHVNFTEWLEYFTDGIIDELLRVSKILQTKHIQPEAVLRPHHQVILNHLEHEGFITDKIYSSLTDRAKPTRNQDFNKLITLGLIERVGKGKATLYRLK